MCRKISYHNTKFFVVTIFWLIGRKLNKPRQVVEKGALGLHLKDFPNMRKKMRCPSSNFGTFFGKKKERDCALLIFLNSFHAF